ncbi:3-oxoacyl-ACP synthase III family protein [Paracoccaceae bacterium GXU_MW_L88]
MTVHLTATGRALPQSRQDLDALAARFPQIGREAFARSGVETRYFCENEDQISLAVTAARAAMDAAGITPQDIDVLINASAVPYQTLPSTAPLLMRALGVPDGKGFGFDVNATCLGFLAGIDAAARWLEIGEGQTALIVAAERASRALPWETAPDVAALFGDGAGAAVVQREARRPHLTPVARHWQSFPAAWEACQIAAGGTRLSVHDDTAAFLKDAVFQMDGEALFRVTARAFRGFLETLLTRAGWRLDEVDLIVPHQASPHALRHMVRMLEISEDRIVDLAAEVGNQIAASLPFTLDVAWREGRIQPGQKLLMLGTAAGVSFGGMALTS